MEENLADVLPLLLPVVGVVTVVVVLVAVVYLLGSGKKPSFEEAKALASKKAEEKLKEREKRHASPRAFKPRKGRKRKNEDAQEDATGSSHPTKGILKSGGEGEMAIPSPSPVNVVPERPKGVDFKLDATPPKASGAKQTRVSPPTPYPKDSVGDRAPKVNKGLPAPMLDIDGASTSAPASDKPEVKKSAASVATNPPPKSSTSSPKPEVMAPQPSKVPATTTTTTSSNVSSSSTATTSEKTGASQQQRKPKSKPKHQAVIGLSQDALPMSRITDILEASSLSDGEIQRLIELLLEKSNANEEWEGASLKGDSNKSLKKNNAELQAKLEEAQQTLVGYSKKVKELRSEIEGEKRKHAASVSGLNERIGQQNNELTIVKTKASGLDEELKKMREVYDQQKVQKLSEENSRLNKEATAHQQQVQSFTKTKDELMDRVAALKKELERSQQDLEQSRAAGAAPGMAEKLANASSTAEHKSREADQLKVELTNSRKEISRLKTELSSALVEKDTCAQNAEASVSSLTKKLQGVTSEKDALLSDRDHLRLELDKTKAAQVQVENLQKSGEKSKNDASESLKEDLSKARQEKVVLAAKVKDLEGDLSKLRKEGDALKDQVKQLEKVREASEKLEQEKARAASERQSLEEKLSSMSKELEEETSSRKELEEKLASRHEVASPQTSAQPLSNGVEVPQELAKENSQLKEEVSVLKKKVEDFKVSNTELTESLGKAKSEVAEEEKEWEKKLLQLQQASEQRAKTVRTDALHECHRAHQGAWQQVFPDVEVFCGDHYEKWLEEFEAKAKAFVDSKKSEIDSLIEKLDELERNSNESTSQALKFKKTLESTMDLLEKLQSQVDSENAKHRQAMEEKEQVLEKERTDNRQLQDDLSRERSKLEEAETQLKKEQDAAARLREEVEAVKESKQANEEQLERIQELEKRLQQVEQDQQASVEKIDTLNKQLREKEKAYSESVQRLASETKLKEEESAKAAELDSELARKKDELAQSMERLEIMKQSNRELNARLSSSRASPTDSEV